MWKFENVKMCYCLTFSNFQIEFIFKLFPNHHFCEADNFIVE